MTRTSKRMLRPLAGAGVVALASSGIVAPQSPAAEAAATGAEIPGVPAGPVIPAQTATAPVRPSAESDPTPAPTAVAAAPSVPVQRHMVVFGDSVANHQSCHCQSFVTRYAQLVRDRADVHVDNLAGSGQTTSSVLHILARRQTRELVRDADTVVVVAGANDFKHAFEEVGQGRWTPAAYRFIAQQVQNNLVRALGTIRRLNPTARVFTFDYWNAFKDGQVARSEYTDRQVEAAQAATDSANAAIAAAAALTESNLVSSKQAFAAAGEITPLLAEDGDHPSEAGNDLLAHTLADAIWVK